MLQAGEQALADRVARSTGFERTVSVWRLTTARAARAFVEALLDERSGEPVNYEAIGYVNSSHASLDGMPLQPEADTSGPSRIVLTEPHRGCLAGLDGFSHIWVIAHLHESIGWAATVDPFLDDQRRGTFATRSPHRPNPISLSLCRLVARRDRLAGRAGPRSPRPHARARHQAVRAVVRLADDAGLLRLVRGASRAHLRAHVRHPVRAAEPALT